MDSPNRYSIEEIQEKLSPLFREPGLQMVLLFGSQVAGQVHPESDIDLGVLFNRSFDLLNITNKVTRLLHTDRVDVIDLKRANPLLAFSAASRGRVLYEQVPGRFNVFYSLSFRRYVDTKKLRDAQAKSIQNFLKEKGLE